MGITKIPSSCFNYPFKHDEIAECGKRYQKIHQTTKLLKINVQNNGVRKLHFT